MLEYTQSVMHHRITNSQIQQKVHHAVKPLELLMAARSTRPPIFWWNSPVCIIPLYKPWSTLTSGVEGP